MQTTAETTQQLLAVKQLPPEVMNGVMTVVGWAFWLGIATLSGLLMWVAGLWWLEHYGDRERHAGQRTEMKIVMILVAAIIMTSSPQIATAVLAP